MEVILRTVAGKRSESEPGERSDAEIKLIRSACGLWLGQEDFSSGGRDGTKGIIILRNHKHNHNYNKNYSEADGGI